MKQNGKRHQARVAAADRFKRRVGPSACCEVCSWVPPALSKRCYTRLNVHHVHPCALGGTDEQDNLVLLCPNHHAVAHIIGPWRGVIGSFKPPGVEPPFRSREELLIALSAIDRNVKGWLDDERDRGLAIQKLYGNKDRGMTTSITLASTRRPAGKRQWGPK